MTPAGTAFGARLPAAVDALRAAVRRASTRIPALLAEWGLTDDPDGLERFAMTCVQALAGQVAVVKPQSAFFERHGARGIAVLERVLAALAGTRHAVHPGRQARRHRLHDGRLRRRLPRAWARRWPRTR